MRDTRPFGRITGTFAGLWALLLAAVHPVWAQVTSGSGAQNVPGDMHLWELAERHAVAAPAPTHHAGDAYLYELAQRVGETAPASTGIDWALWALVALLVVVVVGAATMLVVTARRHHWHPHLPVRRGHA
jgi:hypothetical protein